MKAKQFVILLLIVVVVVGGLSYFGYNKYNPSSSKHAVYDTANVWTRYFNRVGAESHDTSTFAIRLIKDSLVNINGSIKRVIDTNYYVPYDSIIKCDTCSSKHKVIKMFILIPKLWMIQDYNKYGQFIIPDSVQLR